MEKEQELYYNELSIEDAFVQYHTKKLASICDGDTKVIRLVEE